MIWIAVGIFVVLFDLFIYSLCCVAFDADRYLDETKEKESQTQASVEKQA